MFLLHDELRVYDILLDLLNITLCDCSDNDTELYVDYRTFDTVSVERVRLTILDWPRGMRAGVIDFTVFGLRNETL